MVSIFLSSNLIHCVGRLAGGSFKSKRLLVFASGRTARTCLVVAHSFELIFDEFIWHDGTI